MALPDELLPFPDRRPRRTPVSPLGARLSRSGIITRRLRRNRGLRILTYHGVCADEVAGEAWLPRHFVTESGFARQMQILASLGRVVHLPEVISNLVNGCPINEPCFAITFDDGHACTLRHAVPVMDRLGIRGTFFVATGHLDDGTWLLSDRLRVLGSLPRGVTADMHPQLRTWVESPARPKSTPHDEVLSLVDDCWPAVADGIDSRTIETLRPPSWNEMVGLHRAGHEIAAHTATHVILAQESRRRRETEIVHSVRRVREQVSRCDGFAYPNGGPDDFDEQDVDVLRRQGVAYAVTTTPGRCLPPVDLYCLPRSSIGLGHNEHVFALEMNGWLDRRRRRQHLGAWAR